MDKAQIVLREGMNIRVFQKIVDGKRERNVPFIGVLKKVRGSGVNRMITVSQHLEGVEIEKIFPTALPTITKIEVIEEKKKVAKKRKSGSGGAKKTAKKTSKKIIKSKK